LWTDFANWVTDPKAYNWITLVGALSALLAAAFTGYSAYLSRRAQRQFVRAEWRHEFSNNIDFRMICEIFNNTDYTLEIDRVVVRGPVSNVRQYAHGKAQEKHTSWAANEAPMRQETCPPRSSCTVSFIVDPDPNQIRKSANKNIQRLRLMVTKALWNSLYWRFPSGPKFSASLITRRRSSQMRPSRLTHRMRIYPEHAIMIADTIEKIAAQK